MDILLVMVVGSRDRQYYRNMATMPPLGLLYLSAYLKQQTDLKVGIVDFQSEIWSEDAFKQKLAEEKPKIVGLSVYTEAARNARLIADTVKSTLPSTTLILGGAYPAFVEPEEFVKWNSCDILVCGEGEVTFTELVRHVFGLTGAKPLENIHGIKFKKNSKVLVTPKRKLISDLDSLPFPDRDLVKDRIQKAEYEIPFNVSTSRGCPGNCVFCSSRAFWGGKVRFRSPQNIVNELIVLVRKYGMRAFHIIDDTFTSRPKAVMEFCRLVIDKGIEAHWSCESRADIVTPELMKSLYGAGCRSIQFGIESGVQEVLDSIGKHVTIEQIENAVRLAREAGMEVNGSFMLGHYSDTPETMLQTINFVRMLIKKYSMVPWMSLNTPFPGTPQFINQKKLGLTIHTKNFYDLVLSNAHVSTKHFSLDELRRIAIYGWDIMARHSASLVEGWIFNSEENRAVL